MYKLTFKRQKTTLEFPQTQTHLCEAVMNHFSINVVLISEEFLKSKEYTKIRTAVYVVKKDDKYFKVENGKNLSKDPFNFKALRDLYFTLEHVQSSTKPKVSTRGSKSSQEAKNSGKQQTKSQSKEK
jgi:hypothetical protein